MILTSLLLSGLVHFSCVGNQPKFDVPPSGSQEYVLEDPAIEMNHSYISFKWDFVDAGAASTKFQIHCINRCRGQKHFTHETCDLSCDDQCTKGVHAYNFNAIMEDHHSTEFEEAMEADGAKFGKPLDFGGGADAVGKMINDTMMGGHYAVNEQWKCWNTSPCSIVAKGLGSRTIKVNVTYQFYRMDVGANGALFRVNGPSKTMTLREYTVPDKMNPTLEKSVYCACAVIRDGEPDHEHASIGGVHFGGDQNGLVPTKMLQDFKFAMTFQDMNTFTVSATNPTSMPVSFVVMPGTECSPDNGAYQDMITTEKVQLDLPAGATVSVAVPVESAPSESPTAFIQGRGYCINMHKKEPDEKVKYTPRGASNTEMILLADFATKERFKGPWTQTRFWIATDNATLDEVRKVMLPRPTEGIYLRSLFQAATVGGIDFTQALRKRCLEPRLIVGASATQEGTNWFVDTMTAMDAKGLGTWVTKNPAAFQPLFDSTAGKVEMDHAVDVARALLGSANAQVRMSALEYMLKAIPEAKRSAFAAAGGLYGLAAVLSGEDQELAAKALDVAEAYKSKGLEIALYNLSPKAKPDLKVRASKLAKEIKG